MVDSAQKLSASSYHTQLTSSRLQVESRGTGSIADTRQ
jgi:hypothetical protein